MEGDNTHANLVFREVTGTSVTTLTSNSKVVDINVNQEVLERLDAGTLTETSHIVTICWDSVKNEQCPSVCEINFPNRRDATVKTVVSRLTEQHYTRLQSLVQTIYKKFNTRVVYIHHNPLTFGLLHPTLGGFKHLKANLIPLETIFMTLYKDFTKARLQVKLQNVSESSPLSDYRGAEPQEDITSRHEDKMKDKQTLPLTEERPKAVQSTDDSPTDDETERQFQEIERHLRTQRHTMDTRFEQHQEQYQQMNESLQALLKHVNEQKHSESALVTQKSFSKSTPAKPNVTSMPSEGIDASSNDSTKSTSKSTEREDNYSSRCEGQDATMPRSDTTIASRSSDRSSANSLSSERKHDAAFNETRLMSEGASLPTIRLSSFDSFPSGTSTSTSHTRGSYSSSDTSSDRTTYSNKSGTDSSSNDSTLYSSRSTAASSSNRALSSSDRKIQETKTVTREGASQGRSATIKDGQSKWKNEDPDISLSDGRVSDVTQSQRRNSQQTGGPSNSKRVEQPKSAYVPAVEPRVVTTQTSGRVAEISTSSFKGQQRREEVSYVGRTKGDELESIQDVMSAVDEARIDDVVMPPKGQGLDTVLCLDTSQSMGEEGLREMIQIAIDFVDGIEEIASNQDTEENIAVVRLGGRPRIVHHLSNDYTNVREAIEHLMLGGETPLLESLQICLCAIQGGRGSIVNISGCHHLSPRVIVITDGKPSEGYGGSSDVENVQQNVKMNVIAVMNEFKTRKNTPEFPKPWVWIPAGRADKKFLKSLSELCGGVYVEGKNVKTLCPYQQVQVTIGKIYAYLQSGMNIGSEDDVVETALDIFAPELDKESKDSVKKGVQDKLDGKDGCGNIGADNSDFNTVEEYENLPPLGTRVARGPDWKHGNKDSEGPGTIYHHFEENGPNQGVVLVHWDNGMTQKHCYGVNGSYEVWAVTDQPRVPINEEIEIGCEVTRGPDWTAEYSEQDGGPGCVGVVIRKEDDYGVKVRWRETCFVGIYRYKRGGPRDVLLRDPVDILKEITKAGSSEKVRQEVTYDDVAESARKVWTWKWQDDGNIWHEYSQKEVEKLEKAYNASQRSCLVKKGQHGYRVLFKDMVEKGIETGTRRKVSRICVDD